nr:MAG TPA: hemolysin XhlA [Caudoviricetes sp.]
MESIIAAAISGAVTLIVCMVNNHYQNASTRNLLDYRLTKLEEKVDKHNNVVERTYKLEELTALQEEKIKVANHRIEDLEKVGG